jgi:ATP-dependent DNA helicase RecG
MAITLNSNVSELAGVGQSYIQKLKKIGILTVRDLLMYFPRRWDDFSKITPIGQLKVDETASVHGHIIEIITKKSKRGVPVTEAVISDDTGTLKAVWFNQRFLDYSLKKDDEIFLAGTLEWNYGQVSMPSPVWEKVSDVTTISDLKHVGRIVPVYPETEGLTSKWLRTKIAPLAKLVYGIKDYLPEEIKKKNNLMDLPAAVRTMHYPENFAELKKAQHRMTFENLFLMMLAVLNNKKELDTDRAVAIDYDEKIGKDFVDSLPYQLTDAQRKAAWQIIKDMTKNVPMNRLLEGDVGSGKTVVSAMAALMVASKNFQVALLAPTEILAQQHYISLKKLLEPFKIKVAILTGSTKAAEKTEILKGLADGELHIVVGTHALLSPDIKFWTLALVIVDEQHRFGVDQRHLLKEANGKNGKMPHFLSMSATPIPRTLAITVFGDLEISVLDEMPPGRKRVSTHLVPPEKRSDSYKYIAEKVAEGRQVFVICPLVNESDKLGVKSATAEAERLKREVFPDLEIGLLHGKMNGAEKEKVMADFKKGKINILVSTSVIEVGVDIPNASIMVIEGPERFGLAQLHQFRGRVGRGEHQSYCFLFAETWNENTKARLDALISSQDGFELAEKDLNLRGPGELLGLKQSGKIDETLLAAIKDPKLIAEVRSAAWLYLQKNDIKADQELYTKISDFDPAGKLE